MKDAVPELLEQIREKYREAAEADPQRTAVRRRIGEKTSDMADIHAYAEGTGHALSGALTDVLTPENLPDGKLYYNIASRTITPMARQGYEEICEAAEEIQAIRDERDGVHLKAVPADWPEDRVNGLADKAADAEDFRKWLEEPVVNLCESIADSFIRNNAEFRYKSGMSPKIRRDGGANCCEWCADLEGVYDYPNVPKDIYRRHEHCRCVVTYENGRDRQNVWTKERWQADPDELEARRGYGLEDGQGRGGLREAAAAIKIDGEYNPNDIRRAILQASTNFVSQDKNNPESLFGEVCDLVAPLKGFYDLKMHGNPHNVKIFDSPVDSSELARIILRRQDYDGGSIRLLSCETGKIDNNTCVAMELSKMLQVDVMAPTEILAVNSLGETKIMSEEGESGWMRLFHPDGSYEDNN